MMAGEYCTSEAADPSFKHVAMKVVVAFGLLLFA